MTAFDDDELESGEVEPDELDEEIDLLDEQEGKGYGEDEGERDDLLSDDE